ncbi:MAG: GAF domain-containing protein [Anaerolineales bacterium]
MTFNYELLQILFDRMPMGIAVFDRQLQLQRCNPTWAEFIAHYTPSSVDRVQPGVTLDELTPGAAEGWRPILEKVLAGETVQLNAFRSESGGIVSYWDVVFTPLMEEGEVVGVVDVTLDATDRVQTHEALEESITTLREREERLALVMRGTNDGIWDWNIQTDHIYFSPRWKTMLGYSEDEISSDFEAWRRLVHPDDLQGSLQALEEHLQGEARLFELEHRLKHKDGSYRWILARGVLVRDANGEPYRMVGSHTDITARKEAQDRLQARLAFENIITAISTTFINMDFEETDGAINSALQSIGVFAGVDRSYVFLFSGDRKTVDNTHEWCVDGVESQMQRLRGIPIETWAWSNAKILKGEVLHVPDVSELPAEAEAEKREFEAQGIRSFLVVPMLYRGEVMGFLGFDTVRKPKIWAQESIQLLKIVGEIFVNALEHMRAQAIEQGQRQFLELLASGGTLEETLTALVRIIEEQSPGMLGLVLLLDEDGQHLRHGASVSLPADYVESVDGLRIGPQVGSCGTASFHGERVVVEDIATDPRWEGLRDLALQHGLRACWSEPVVRADGRVAGTFAMYYRYPRVPTDAELRTIETAAHLVGVAIERKEAEETLRRSEERFRIAAESATDLIYEWDLVTDKMEWFGDIDERLGYEPGELPRMRVTWERLIHPEDRDRVLRAVERHVESGGAYFEEYRVLQKDGTILYWKDRGRVLRSESGEAQRWIGATTDITERVLAQQNLEQRITERTDELATLISVQQAITSDLDLDAVLQMIAEEALRLTGVQRSVVLLLDKKRERLVVSFVAGEEPSNLIGESLPVYDSLSGQHMLDAEPLLITDMRNDERVEVAQRSRFRSQVSVPLMTPSGPLGVIAVSDPEPHRLGQNDVRVLTMLASSAVIGLENARLYAEEQERRAEAERRRRVAEGLRDILTFLNANRSFEQELDYIVYQASQLLGASAGVIYRADMEEETIAVEAASGAPPALLELGALPSIGERVNQTILQRQPVAMAKIDPEVSTDLAEGLEALDPRLIEWKTIIRTHYRAYLAVPLIIKDELYGALVLYYLEPREFSEEDIGLGMALGGQVALAIENARLRANAEQMAVAAERNRLARDLHDAVTQTLFSASLIAEVLPVLWERNPEEGHRRLQELRELTRGALAEMRTLLLELRPATLVEAEMGELLRQLAEAITGRARLPVDLQVSGGDAPLPAEVKVAFYRIAQEALNNVVKHAGASQVSIAYEADGDGRGVRLAIRDDGQGFDPAAIPPDHLGVSIMNERAENVGARLNIVSETGEGTEVAVVWPLDLQKEIV